MSFAAETQTSKFLLNSEGAHNLTLSVENASTFHLFYYTYVNMLAHPQKVSILGWPSIFHTFQMGYHM